MIPPLSGPVDFHPDLVSIILISDLEPGHVCCDKFSQCKPNVGRSKPPDPLNQCCFNAECWIWLLSAWRCWGHHTYPSKPAFVGNVDYEGCRGDLCFKAGAAFPWPSAQGRRNARVKASLWSTSRNICMDGLFTSKPRMTWARTLYICGLKKGTIYSHVCNDHAGGPSMWFSGLVYLSGSKSALKTCFRCCSNLLLGSKPSLNCKNDICELIELLCGSCAGTCSRRPGQSLWRRLRWRGTLREERLPRSIFWDQKMDPKMGPPY